MKKSSTTKFLSFASCFFGLVSAFFTGMFLASGSLKSIPALIMLLSILLFIISVLSYIYSSAD